MAIKRRQDERRGHSCWSRCRRGKKIHFSLLAERGADNINDNEDDSANGRRKWKADEKYDVDRHVRKIGMSWMVHADVISKAYRKKGSPYVVQSRELHGVRPIHSQRVPFRKEVSTFRSFPVRSSPSLDSFQRKLISHRITPPASPTKILFVRTSNAPHTTRLWETFCTS